MPEFVHVFWSNDIISFADDTTLLMTRLIRRILSLAEWSAKEYHYLQQRT